MFLVFTILNINNTNILYTQSFTGILHNTRYKTNMYKIHSVQSQLVKDIFFFQKFLKFFGGVVDLFWDLFGEGPSSTPLKLAARKFHPNLSRLELGSGE